MTYNSAKTALACLFCFAGDLVPPYKAMLLNAFLVGTKDSDHLVRASSLSNLGEICKALGFRIGPVVTEVSFFFFLVDTCQTCHVFLS